MSQVFDLTRLIKTELTSSNLNIKGFARMSQPSTGPVHLRLELLMTRIPIPQQRLDNPDIPTYYTTNMSSDTTQIPTGMRTIPTGSVFLGKMLGYSHRDPTKIPPNMTKIPTDDKMTIPTDTATIPTNMTTIPTW
jgi:hypothetical protein